MRELTAFGDRLIMELDTSDLSRKINEDYMRSIRRRGHELIRCFLELEEGISAYTRLQEEECGMTDRHIEGALWIVQKAGPP